MKRTLAFIVLIAALLAGCSALKGSELSSNRSRWESASIKHYRYKLNVGCFCAFSQRMPLTIEVRDGKVLSMSYSDGQAVSEQERQTFAPYQTIDDVFAFTADAIKRADDIKLHYDPTYGFPTLVQIDFIKNAADDELSLYVSDFTPLP